MKMFLTVILSTCALGVFSSSYADDCNAVVTSKNAQSEGHNKFLFKYVVSAYGCSPYGCTGYLTVRSTFRYASNGQVGGDSHVVSYRIPNQQTATDVVEEHYLGQPGGGENQLLDVAVEGVTCSTP